MNRVINRPYPLQVLGAVGLAAGLGVVAFAATADAHPPAPPPEAIAACDGKARGDACSVQIHEHTITGTCDALPDVTVLACRPNGPPPPPPPEALAACDGKARGDACSVQIHEHTITGTCDSPPGASALACRPDGPPPPPPDAPNR